MKSKKYSDTRLNDLRKYVDRYIEANDTWKQEHNDKNFVTRTELLTWAGIILASLIGILALILKK